MDKLLEQLGGLFLSSLPTVVLLTILFYFLKALLFDPLEKILADRYQKTEGKEKGAAEAMQVAERKADEHAKAIQMAKAEIYAQQDLLRQSLEAEKEAAITAAAERTQTLLAEGRASIEQQLLESQGFVDREAASLARLIAEKVLYRGAA